MPFAATIALWILGRFFDYWGAMWLKLLFALAIDLVGVATYIFPGGGEVRSAVTFQTATTSQQCN